MSTLPNLKPREVAKILSNAGFVDGGGSGAHRTFRHLTKGRYTTVSFHPGTVPQGTLHAIIKQSGMSVEEFISFRKKKE